MLQLPQQGGADTSAADEPDQNVDRRLRALALAGLVVIALAVALLAGRRARPTIIGWEGSFFVAVLICALWNRLPDRRRPDARFRRDELMSASFVTIIVVGGRFAPDMVKHATSTSDWIRFAILLAVMFVGFVVAERRDAHRVEQELRQWRRTRPQVRPKTR